MYVSLCIFQAIDELLAYNADLCLPLTHGVGSALCVYLCVCLSVCLSVFLLRKIALPYPHKCLVWFCGAKRIDRQVFF